MGKPDEPLGAGYVRCGRCGDVVGNQVSECIDGRTQVHVVLSDPEHAVKHTDLERNR